jgi:hypothetical protein
MASPVGPASPLGSSPSPSVPPLSAPTLGTPAGPASFRHELDLLARQSSLGCYVHTRLEVCAIREDGSWVGEGEVGFFWPLLSPDGSTKVDGEPKAASLAQLQSHFGFGVVSVSADRKVATLSEPSDASQRAKMDPLRGAATSGKSSSSSSSSSSSDLFRTSRCAEQGVRSLVFYPSLGIVHKTYWFKGCEFPATRGSTLDRARWSPLSRRGLLLELNTASGEDGSEFDPNDGAGGGALQFAAAPFRSLAAGWSEMGAGGAALLVQPTQLTLSRAAAREWALGPAPERVFGVDFSRSFSLSPLIAVQVERRAAPYWWRVFAPVLLAGLVGSLSLLRLPGLCEKAAGNALLNAAPAAAAAAAVLALRAALCCLRAGALVHHRRFFDLYCLLAVGYLAAVAGATAAWRPPEHEPEPAPSTTVFAAALAAWLVVQAALICWAASDRARGHWEQVVSDTLASASAPPTDVAKLFRIGASKARVLPLITYHSLHNVADPSKAQQETGEMVRSLMVGPMLSARSAKEAAAGAAAVAAAAAAHAATN